jgi:hypothetical protein
VAVRQGRSASHVPRRAPPVVFCAALTTLALEERLLERHGGAPRLQIRWNFDPVLQNWSDRASLSKIWASTAEVSRIPMSSGWKGI